MLNPSRWFQRSNFHSARLWLLVIPCFAVVLDQVTKLWAYEVLKTRPNGMFHIFWVLDFQLLFNSGAILGFGPNSGIFFVVVALVVTIIFIYLVLLKPQTRIQDKKYLFALSLIIGGAVGNAVDRLFRQNPDPRQRGFGEGAVVDFIDIGRWPVFNIADVFITIGFLFAVFFGIQAAFKEQAAVAEDDIYNVGEDNIENAD